MRAFRVVVLSVIIVAVAPVLDRKAPRKRTLRGGTESFRLLEARLVGDAYAPRAFFRSFDRDRDDPPPLPSTEDPLDRGRALFRRGEISEAIPELRDAARDGDPAALTDLAAALVSEHDAVARGRSRSWFPSDPSSRYRSAIEAIDLLQRAIDQEPDLAEAHFNLALALEQVGLTVEARAKLQQAIGHSVDIEWNREARRHAERLLLSDHAINRRRIDAYVAVTGDSDARRLLLPYLEAQKQRLGRWRLRDFPAARLSRAAETFTYGVDSVAERLVQAMKIFCPHAKGETCATRYYTSAALHAAGRKSEAATWLHSIDDEVKETHGAAGLHALLRWEEGLNSMVRGDSRKALDIFEAQYVEQWAVNQPEFAAVFDELRRTVRGYLASEALFQGDVAAAFEYTDQSSLHDVRRALAPDAAILRYETTLPSQMVVFVVRRESVEVVYLDHGAHRTLAGEVAAAEAMRIADDATFGAAASRLHDLVFAPVLEKLRGVSTIAIIRNFELAEIPFGALFDAQNGAYVAERFTIVHASSARAAVEQSKRARDVSDPTMLAIGATEFDRTQAQVLQAVDREIAAITAQSMCARVFSREDATPEAVQRALAENAVIHYGGHIVRRGADVRLLLAPSRGRDGLSAREIAALRLDKARVVVLAGCGGAASGDPHAILRTMADAFLIAGVPTVIATSYDLDDGEAPPTMQLLHTFLRGGTDAAEALRRTTLIELRSGRSVPLSIRFQALGGTTALVQ